MLFCKHNSAFAQPSPVEVNSQVFTPLSYSELTLKLSSEVTFQPDTPNETELAEVERIKKKLNPLLVSKIITIFVLSKTVKSIT